MHDINWGLLRYALMTVRKGSASGAAEALGVTHATILRGLKRLEQETGTKLFNKSPSGYTPTEQGRQLIELADEIESRIYRWRLSVENSRPQVSGILRLATTEIIADGILCPRLPDFYNCYPELQLDINTSYEFCNLTRYETDVALRATESPPEHLIGRQICKISWAIYQSRDPLKKNDHWVGFADSSLPPAKWLPAFYPDAHIRYKATSVHNLLGAAKFGVGKALLPCFLADNEPSLEKLEQLPLQYSTQLWLLFHQESRDDPKLRVFVEWIKSQLDCELI